MRVRPGSLQVLPQPGAWRAEEATEEIIGDRLLVVQRLSEEL